MTPPKAGEREQRAGLVAGEREPVPRRWLHIGIRLAE
jgi:hypothetical protein